MLIKKKMYYVLFTGFILRKDGGLNSIKEVAC